jgi:rRNA maturation RNase YbeY
MLRLWLETIASHHGAQIDHLSYAFGSSNWMADLNQRYLAHEGDTDILTFDYSGPGSQSSIKGPRSPRLINGECCISPGMIREQAAFWKTTFEEEMHRVLVHGLFHLLGFDDRTPTQKKQMRSLEEKALALRRL